MTNPTQRFYKYHFYCNECNSEWKEDHNETGVLGECECGEQIEADSIEDLSVQSQEVEK